jgi:hypothetical protein
MDLKRLASFKIVAPVPDIVNAAAATSNKATAVPRTDPRCASDVTLEALLPEAGSLEFSSDTLSHCSF